MCAECRQQSEHLPGCLENTTPRQSQASRRSHRRHAASADVGTPSSDRVLVLRKETNHSHTKPVRWKRNVRIGSQRQSATTWKPVWAGALSCSHGMSGIYCQQQRGRPARLVRMRCWARWASSCAPGRVFPADDRHGNMAPPPQLPSPQILPDMSKMSMIWGMGSVMLALRNSPHCLGRGREAKRCPRLRTDHRPRGRGRGRIARDRPAHSFCDGRRLGDSAGSRYVGEPRPYQSIPTSRRITEDVVSSIGIALARLARRVRG